MLSTGNNALLNTLRRVPLFADLSETELASIVGHTSTCSYDAGQIVFSEGEKSEDLLIVKEGAVRVVQMAPNGRQQLIAIERPGSSLGEVSLFDGGPYSTTAIAITPLELIRLDGVRFRELCVQQPLVALKVIRVLGYRLRQLRRLIESLSFATVRSRLIAYIVQMAQDQGSPTQAGMIVSTATPACLSALYRPSFQRKIFLKSGPTSRS